MIEILTIGLTSVAAGVIQSVTGFGAAVILMLVVPLFFDMVAAPALASAITLGLSTTLAWKFRRHIDWRIGLLPTAVYLLFSLVLIRVAKQMQTDVLAFGFGIFLIFLALFFFFFSQKITLRGSWLSACVCATISGITSGLFGTGGPLMAIYFVSTTKSKESYIANLQFLFASTNIINLIARISNGIYTPDLIPMTLLGILGITLGKRFGLKILDRIDPALTKKLVYGFIGISGLITVIQQAQKLF